ncbi:MAG: hypothetical protein C0468_03075 [Planctomyces sp.]|nr:hypothetical protein [Planctomyces sp.]MBA4119725.1 hypothetical protein [Isosphaera sp.]
MTHLHVWVGQIAAAAVAQGPSEGAGSAQGAGRSLLGYIDSGGLISYILILLSVGALALIVWNLIVLRRAYLAPAAVALGLEQSLRSKNLDTILEFSRREENRCLLTRVIAAGLWRVARSSFGLLELKPSLELAGQREFEKLERPNYVLGMLAAVGPMLGLLGTVLGIIRAFAELGAEVGAARSSRLSDAMSLALVTTAEGLVLAIPCTFAHSAFRRRLDHLAGEIGDIAETLVSVLVTNVRPAGAQGAAPAQAAAPAQPGGPAVGQGVARQPAPVAPAQAPAAAVPATT